MRVYMCVCERVCVCSQLYFQTASEQENKTSHAHRKVFDSLLQQLHDSVLRQRASQCLHHIRGPRRRLHQLIHRQLRQRRGQPSPLQLRPRREGGPQQVPPAELHMCFIEVCEGLVVRELGAGRRGGVPDAFLVELTVVNTGGQLGVSGGEGREAREGVGGEKGDLQEGGIEDLVQGKRPGVRRNKGAHVGVWASVCECRCVQCVCVWGGVSDRESIPWISSTPESWI